MRPINTIEVAIEEAVAELGILPASFHKCDEQEAQSIMKRTKAVFVEGNPSVWWFSLRHKVTVQHFPDGGFRHLLDYVPSHNEVCWFIPEIHEAYSLVYEVRASHLIDILGNCFGFDYYLVGKRFDWLVGETDADQLIVSIGPS